MAESYKGLTIRIGGDTTRLSKALRAANGAASQTQAELKKVGQALKLDPTNIKAYNTQLGLMSEQATNVSMKLASLAETQRQMSKKKITVKTIDGGKIVNTTASIAELIQEVRELEDISDNESLNVGKRLGVANTALGSVTESLARAHNELTKLVKDSRGFEVERLKNALDLAAGKKSIDEVKSSLETFNDDIARSPEAINRLTQSVKVMADKLSEAINPETGKINQKKLGAALRSISTEDLIVGVTLDPEAINEVLERIRDLDEKDTEIIAEKKKKIESLAKTYQEKVDKRQERQAAALEAYDAAKKEVEAARAVVEAQKESEAVTKAEAKHQETLAEGYARVRNIIISMGGVEEVHRRGAEALSLIERTTGDLGTSAAIAADEWSELDTQLESVKETIDSLNSAKSTRKRQTEYVRLAKEQFESAEQVANTFVTNFQSAMAKAPNTILQGIAQKSVSAYDAVFKAFANSDGTLQKFNYYGISERVDQLADGYESVADRLREIPRDAKRAKEELEQLKSELSTALSMNDTTIADRLKSEIAEINEFLDRINAERFVLVTEQDVHQLKVGNALAEEFAENYSNVAVAITNAAYAGTEQMGAAVSANKDHLHSLELLRDQYDKSVMNVTEKSEALAKKLRELGREEDADHVLSLAREFREQLMPVFSETVDNIDVVRNRINTLTSLTTTINRINKKTGADLKTPLDLRNYYASQREKLEDELSRRLDAVSKKEEELSKKRGKRSVADQRTLDALNARVDKARQNLQTLQELINSIESTGDKTLDSYFSASANVPNDDVETLLRSRRNAQKAVQLEPISFKDLDAKTAAAERRSQRANAALTSAEKGKEKITSLLNKTFESYVFTEEELAEAEKNRIERDKQSEQIQKRVTNAIEGERKAVEGLAKARENLAKAQLSYDKAVKSTDDETISRNAAKAYEEAVKPGYEKIQSTIQGYADDTWDEPGKDAENLLLGLQDDWSEAGERVAWLREEVQKATDAVLELKEAQSDKDVSEQDLRRLESAELEAFARERALSDASMDHTEKEIKYLSEKLKQDLQTAEKVRKVEESVATVLDMRGAESDVDLGDYSVKGLDESLDSEISMLKDKRDELKELYESLIKARKQADLPTDQYKDDWANQRKEIDSRISSLEKERAAYARIREISETQFIDPKTLEKTSYQSSNVIDLFREINELQVENNRDIKQATELREELVRLIARQKSDVEQVEKSLESSTSLAETDEAKSAINTAKRELDALNTLVAKAQASLRTAQDELGLISSHEDEGNEEYVSKKAAAEQEVARATEQVNSLEQQQQAKTLELSKAEKNLKSVQEKSANAIASKRKQIEDLNASITETEGEVLTLDGYLERLATRKAELSSDRGAFLKSSGAELRNAINAADELTRDTYKAGKTARDESIKSDKAEIIQAHNELIGSYQRVGSAVDSVIYAQNELAIAEAKSAEFATEDIRQLKNLEARENERAREEEQANAARDKAKNKLNKSEKALLNTEEKLARFENGSKREVSSFTAAINEETEAAKRLAKAKEDLAKYQGNGIANILSSRAIHVSDLTAQVFKSENGNTDMDFMSAVYRSIADSAGLSREQAAALTSDMSRLVDQFKVAESEVQKWKIIAKFEDLNNEIVKGEAQVNNFAEALASMDNPSDIMRGDTTNYQSKLTAHIAELVKNMPNLRANVEALSGAYEELTTNGNLFAKSFDINPNNIQSLESAMSSYASAELVAVEYANRLKEQMKAYEADGVTKWDNDMVSLQQSLYEASVEADKAQKNFNRLGGQIAYLENAIEELKGKRAEIALPAKKSDDPEALTAEEVEAIKYLERTAHDLSAAEEALEGLNDEREEALDLMRATRAELQRLQKINEYEGLASQLEEGEQKIVSAHKKLVEFNQTIAVKQHFGNLDELEKLSDDFKAATTRAKTFQELANQFPDDIRITTAAMEALAEKERLAELYMEKLGKAIESVDTSDADVMRDNHGSIDSAARAYVEGAAEIGAQLTKAKSELSDIIRDNAGGASDDLVRVRKLIASLTLKYDSFSSGADKAAILQERDKLVEMLGAAMKETRVDVKVSLDLDTSVAEEVKKLQDKLKSIGSSVAQSLPETTFDLSNIDKVIGDAVSKAKSLGDTFSTDADNVDAYAMAVSALEEAMGASVIEASRLSEVLSSYDSDSIDQTAVDMNQVSLNALRAEESVRRANEAVDEAKKNYDDLKKKYEEASKGTDVAKTNDIKNQMDDARKAYEDAGKAAEKATKALDLAKASKEIEAYTKRAIQFEESVKNIAKQSLELSNTASIASVFGDTSEIDELKTEFDNAVKKAKELKEQLKASPDDDSVKKSLNAQLDEVNRLKEAYSNLVSTSLGLFDHDAELQRLMSKYGSLGEAVVKTRSEYKNLSVSITRAQAELVKLLGEAGIDAGGAGFYELKNIIQQNANQINGSLMTSILAAADALEQLLNEQQELAEDSGLAAVIRLFEQLADSAGTAAKEVANLNKAEKDSKSSDSQAAFMSAVREIGQEARQAGQKIVTSAKTIDAAYRDMRKTVDGTEKQFAELRKAAIEFSQVHAVSSDQILEMEALGGQLGIAASELQQFGELASNLVIATDIEEGDVALQLGQISNIMDDLKDMDALERFGDALVRLGNNAAAQESSIMNVAQRIAAVANVTSMSSAQVLGWASAVAETGMRSESAATAIVNTIEGIGNAVSAGGATLEQFASIAGMSADEFKAKWENSSSEALQAFVEGLETLTDDSTAAIAALDSVGISSVRQETALLALSQTVDNLSANINMAEAAFRSGGDAAKEAQNKSEGVSGSLAILQNNIDVLAASLGESLKPFIDIAIAALRVLNGILDGIGPAARTVIVGVGGIAAVLGTTIPVIDQFVKGWNDITADKSSAMFVALKDHLAKFFGAVKQTTTAVKAMAMDFGDAIVTGQGLGAAFSAMGTGAAGAAAGVGALVTTIAPLLIITAVVAAVGAVIDAFNEWREHAEAVDKATRGLTEAVYKAPEAFNQYASGAKKAAKSVQELREASDDAIKSQAELADSLGERWADIGTNNAVINDYVKTIERLTEKQKLNRDEQVELAAAVEGYNEMTGQTVEIIDEEAGILNTSTDVLKDNAKAWKERAESEAAYEMYKDVLKQRIKDDIALTEVKNKLTEAEGKQVTTTGLLYNGYKANTGEVVELKKQQKELEAAIASADKTMQSYEGHMLTAKQKLAQVESALVEAGDSLDNYKFLTKENLAHIANMWSGDVSKVLDYIKTLNNASKDVEKPDVSQKPSDDAAEQYKNELERQYTEQKRIRDDFYDDEKKKRDDAVEDRKRELDDEYDITKDTLDKEYENRKQELDDEYDAEKDKHDKSYDLLKRELDKEHDLRKRELDKEYDDRKKALDKEYDAAKDASDKWLKQYKKAQEAETEAFKDATDARVKEIDREYDAKKKLLDSEYEGYDSDIDDRIKAIEAEQDAEDKALKQQERQEKLAELGKAVETAKGTKKREEAEKALQDYKDELAREDIKEQRQAQIEKLNDQKSALKEQLSDREDHLKETYDAVKEEYKAERDARLEAIKESQEAEYEAAKESEDAKLEAMKEANDTVLENMKLAHEDELNELKLKHEDILTTEKDSNEAQLLVVKRRHETELQGIKDSNEQKLKVLKRGHEDELEDLKYQNEEVLKGLKRGHEDELTEIKEFNDRKYKAYKEGGDAAVAALTKSADAAKTGVVGTFSMSDVDGEGAVAGMMHGVTRGVRDGAAEPLIAVDAVKNRILGTLKITDEEAKATTSSLATGAANGANEGAEQALIGVGAIKSRMLDTFKITDEEAKAATAGITSGAASSINEGAAEPAMAAGNAKSGMIGAFSVSEIEGKGAVSGLTHGVAQGVRDGSAEPREAADLLMVDMLTPLRNLWKESDVPIIEWLMRLAASIGENSDKPVAAVGNVKDQMVSAAGTKEGDTDSAAKRFMTDWANSLTKNSEKPLTNVRKTGESVSKLMDISKSSEAHGSNAAASFNNGFLKNAQQVIQNAQSWASSLLSTVKNTLGIHSPSREFRYISEMLFAGFNGQWERDEDGTLRMVRGTAQSIDSAFGSGIGAYDISMLDEEALKSQMDRMQNIVNQGLDDMYTSMRDRLLKQADMMQEILASGFDPTRTVDAAYEAIGKINAGELRTKQMIASAQPIDASTYAPVISINIPEVVVREQADIDRLSQQIALRVQRSLNARIG